MTSAKPEHDDSVTLRRLALLVIGCVSCDLAALMLLHILQPNLNALRRPMSNYVLGPYGFLMTGVMISAPLIMISLAYGWHRTLARPYVSKLNLIPMAIAILGLLLMALYSKRSTANEEMITRSDRIHVTGALIGLAWVHLVMLRLSLRVRSDRLWRPFASRSLTLAVFASATFVVLQLWKPAFGGALQRLDVVLILFWSLLAALRLRLIARHFTTRMASTMA